MSRRKRPAGRSKKVALLGHFGAANFGNEITLQAVLHNLVRLQPSIAITCICTDADTTAATHYVEAFALTAPFLAAWAPRTHIARLVRWIILGLPAELYRLVRGLIVLRRTDGLIISGTGLLTDAYGLCGWGPFTLFKWTVIAKLCRRRTIFLSVGAGPIYSRMGRFFVRGSLSLADARSFRDESTKRYLTSIGAGVSSDPVYPDLAFSFPEAILRRYAAGGNERPILGLGLMAYAGRYSVAWPSPDVYRRYIGCLARLAAWTVEGGYDVRLLIGDVADVRAKADFLTVLRESGPEALGHVVDEPISSVEDLVAQVGASDLVVATRFHNVLTAMLCGKPVVALSFHPKCDSLMRAMTLADYCLDINALDANTLIEAFCLLERNSETLKPLIINRVAQFREALDEQYRWLLGISSTDAPPARLAALTAPPVGLIG